MVTSATLFLTYLRCFNYIFFCDTNLCVCGQGDSVIYRTSVNTYARRGAALAATPRTVNRALATQPERCCCCCTQPGSAPLLLIHTVPAPQCIVAAATLLACLAPRGVFTYSHQALTRIFHPFLLWNSYHDMVHTSTPQNSDPSWSPPLRGVHGPTKFTI